VVGELAWSIENMLNRVIDKTTQPNAVMMQLISAVVELVPVLMVNFQDRIVPTFKTDGFMSAADLFAKAQALNTDDINWAIEYTYNRLSTSTAIIEQIVEQDAALHVETVDVQPVIEQVVVKVDDEFDLGNVTIPVMAAIQIDEPKDDLEDNNQDLEAISFGDFEDEGSFDVPMDM